MKALHKCVLSIFIVGVTLLIPLTSAMANKYGFWTVNNIGLGASLQQQWGSGLSMTLKERAYAQPPTGVLNTISVAGEARDRCQVTEPWQIYISLVGIKYSSNDTGIVSKSGNYQDCGQFENHEYKDTGQYFYYWPAVGLNTTKYLTDIH